MLQKILLIRPGAIGDTLMLLPSISILARSHEVYVAGRRPGIEFLSPPAKQCFDMEESAWHMLFLESQALPGLPIDEVDIVVCFLSDPQGTIRNNLKAYCPGAKVFVFPSLPGGLSKMHVAQHVARCLARCGAIVDGRAAMELATREALLAEDRQWSIRHKLVLHPGSGSKKKNYSLSLWEELMQKITRQIGDSSLKQVILLGPAEQDTKSLFAETAERLGWDIKSNLSSDALLTLMRETALFVGHDSGISHLAAMAGAHTIALFKVTEPLIWRPLGPRVAVLEGIGEGQGLVSRILKELDLRSLSASDK